MRKVTNRPKAIKSTEQPSENGGRTKAPNRRNNQSEMVMQNNWTQIQVKT